MGHSCNKYLENNIRKLVRARARANHARKGKKGLNGARKIT